MKPKSSHRDVVLNAFRRAEVPDALGLSIVAILAKAGFRKLSSSHHAKPKTLTLLTPVDQLEGSLLLRMEVEHACPQRRARIDGYNYARIAVWTCRGLVIPPKISGVQE